MTKFSHTEIGGGIYYRQTRYFIRVAAATLIGWRYVEVTEREARDAVKIDDRSEFARYVMRAIGLSI